LLYLVGAMTALEDRLYDFFLRFRANRERIDSVAFLDVDDQAIAYYGFFPWPRSITADGLLRLKEYGARAVIFDIEYINRGPQGVDSLYLEQGLGYDFDRAFLEIDVSAQDIFSAIGTGRIGRNDVSTYAERLSSIIARQKIDLYGKAQGVARDNDLYLAQALALNGRSWSTLNLWAYPLEGEEAERRLIAEERFSYPVNASPNASRGAGDVDILPALPIFSNAAKGAGYTNVEIDDDGVRRRIFLTQNMHDHWYLQLSFAPLIDYLGNPEIVLEKRRLTIKQAQLPDGRVKDIVIPLDYKGRMMLDWPKEDYSDSYTHISFADFSLLDEIESQIVRYTHALSGAELDYFTQFDSSLSHIKEDLFDMIQLFDASYEYRNLAMENTDNDYFDNFLKYRNYAYGLLSGILEDDPVTKIMEISDWLCEENPGMADMIEDEAGYITLLLEYLEINLNRHIELSESKDLALRDKFVIIGRVDTGTTDYGANPFYGKYINVGTHGVVLDTILSESFIIPLRFWWCILFMFIVIPIFFHLSGSLTPVIRASCGFGAALLFFIGTILLFRFTGIFLGPLGTVFAMISAIIVREVISYAGSEKEKAFIRTAFSTYVSSDVVKEIIADPSRLQLGGTKYYMTAVFTDIKGFSTISEKLGDPAKLVSLLNKYLSAMSDVVLDQKGTIDKYIGDAIVAFFGAPIPLEDHALRACVSAIKMKKVELELNKVVMEENLSPIPLLTRIGINTGSMVAGNMGTENKMNYTIMGNAVNLAARLESVNSQYGTWMLASEETVKQTGDAVLYRKLDRVRVVGINEPVRLCELIDIADHATEQDKNLVTVFHQALECFEKREWKQAMEGFNETLKIKPDDVPSTLYLDRLKQFSVSMPSESWDGVYNLKSK
ncbi:MAG: adenylate/guanylate cyclase domain-containing protein, partial [Treponema sp.]|nr:adenylate/guanylate cyclase domain-containing protein [Treponema sp.]